MIYDVSKKEQLADIGTKCLNTTSVTGTLSTKAKAWETEQ